MATPPIKPRFGVAGPRFGVTGVAQPNGSANLAAEADPSTRIVSTVDSDALLWPPRELAWNDHPPQPVKRSVRARRRAVEGQRVGWIGVLCTIVGLVLGRTSTEPKVVLPLQRSLASTELMGEATADRARPVRRIAAELQVAATTVELPTSPSPIEPTPHHRRVRRAPRSVAVGPEPLAERPPARPELERPPAAPTVLERARIALASGDYDRAYHSAQRSLRLGAGSDAYAVMARAACRNGERDAARSAVRELPLRDRFEVRRDCRRNGAPIGVLGLRRP